MNAPTDKLDAGTAVVCRDATVTYPGGVCALDHINLAVRQGERLALVGPSGCGKTTLLRVIAGLQSLTNGECQRSDRETQRSDQEAHWSQEQGGDRRSVATSFVFQQPALLPWANVLQNVTLPLTLGRRRDRPSAKAMQERAVAAIQEVQLADAVARYPHQLSGGMKMRASIARALVTQPEFLLLDEPFAALDDLLRNQLGRLLLQLWRHHRFTSVLVTHNIAEAIQLSERICVMHQGRIVRELDNPLATSEPHADLRRTNAFAEFFGEVSDTLEDAASSTSEGSCG
ncbi:ABC transporter ATP-binding protein [Rhodopirellula sp. P2]|uniref:ABC transporter ATP-binding protein n=1 Tax=Rhodopirellula sp. P2 TaxID=2127060 RepID=UPI00236776D3|nr:ABC transporter ATP-binding protein [Rhodopirellula sp. P2]WDQ18666.1 ABC transporter ATP-binding protein [Rhodopirellula sp. P2]